MRPYDNIDTMFLDACTCINIAGRETPSRDGFSKEILGYCGRLLNPRANFLVNPTRKLSPPYAAAEFLWYLSGTDQIEMIQKYAPQYKRFTEDGKTAWGSYGHRWLRDPSFTKECLKCSEDFNFDVDEFIKEDRLKAPISQLQAIAWLLKRKPESRQAVMTMWNAGDLVHAILGDKNDLPCTTSLNFIIRENRLYLTATMRSNDIWLGFPYDVWCFTNLQMLLASVLDLELGWYQHQAMSLHVYDRNIERMKKVCFEEAPKDYPVFSYHTGLNRSARLSDTIRNLILKENEMSSNERYDSHRVSEDTVISTLLGQCYTMCGLKWDYENAINHIMNSDLKHYCENLRS